MRTLSQALRVDILAEAAQVYGESGRPTTLRATPTTADRMIVNAPAELEQDYLSNPTVFNGVNKIVQTIMSANHFLEAKDKKVKAYFDVFLSNIGMGGGEASWEELLEIIFKYQCIYGWAWIEKVWNKRGNSIVDFDYVDPKTMDYAKNSTGKIVMDVHQRPVGYAQKIPMDQMSVGNHPTPEWAIKLGVSNPMQIFIPREKMALFKLYTVGDGFYPVGLIEPIYKTSLRKLNIEEALASAIYRHGFPTMWAKVGDLNHEPTPQQIERALEKLQNISFKNELATPFYFDLQMIETKKAEKLREYLEYFKQQEVSGLGIPMPYATGGGEATNRATLGNQTSMFQLTLRDIINTTVETIRRELFKPICDLQGFKEVPTISWDIVGVDEIDKKAARLLKYVQAGILKPDMKMIDFIKQIEGLD